MGGNEEKGGPKKGEADSQSSFGFDLRYDSGCHCGIFHFWKEKGKLLLEKSSRGNEYGREERNSPGEKDKTPGSSSPFTSPFSSSYWITHLSRTRSGPFE